jgi:hypothetical protein
VADGRTIRLFLVDGSATGLLTAEIMNWTGHTLVVPRTRLAEALKRDEASKTGIYFLVGDDPGQHTKTKVYIGEADSVADRIKTHAVDESKDFWTRACIVTSKDTNLTKAHVRYLEARLVELTKAADRANLANGNEPSQKSLPEADIADMEFFLSQIQLILPAVGFDFLRALPRIPQQPVGSPVTGGPTAVELVLNYPKYGITANAIDLDGEVTVLFGSQALADVEFEHNDYKPLRDQLVADGRLSPQAGKNYMTFTENVAFSSPSAAAAVVQNRNSNGRIAWKVKATGQTLKDWEDSQLSG